MAFNTEFVMGAGGAGGSVEVEEIPVSMSGGGGSSSNPTNFPLATVDAGAGAWVWADGALSPGATGLSAAPQLLVGDRAYTVTGNRAGGGGWFTGTVGVSVQSRSSSTTTFTGAVYVTRM